MLRFKVTSMRVGATSPKDVQPDTARSIPDESPAPGPRPSKSAGPTTALGAVLAFAALAVCLRPSALRHLGLAAWTDSLERAGALRYFLALAPLAYALACLQKLVRPSSPDRSAVAWDQFARAAGGTLTRRGRTVTADGWEGGARVDMRVDDFDLTLDVVSKDRMTHSRMRVPIESRHDFAFLLVRESAAMKLVTSKTVWGGVSGLARATFASDGDGGDKARAMLDHVSFLGQGDVAIGDPDFDRTYILLASEPNSARELFSNAAVRQALDRLQPFPARAQLSLVSDPGAAGLLEYREPGTVGDAARLESIHVLVAAVLRHLAGRSFIRGRALRTA